MPDEPAYAMTNNAPRTVTEQGHEVLLIRQEGGFHHVLIRKA